MTFVTELDVRRQGGLNDFSAIPPERLRQCLNDAHAEILAETTLTDASPIDVRVIRAESKLALANLIGSLSLAEAASAQDVSLPGVRVDEHAGADSRRVWAERLREEAWSMLRPYLRTRQPKSLHAVREAQS
ncbi:MAG: hypothetical protein GC154_12560 [bacterium]|nr:hypothetical protein [bacterium]